MKKTILYLLLFTLLISLPTQGVAAQGSDSSEFVSETIPDNTTILPGASFTKTWTIRNNGQTTWTTAYSFVLIEGAAMGATSVNLPKEVKPGETVDIAVNMTAPAYGGVVINRYQLKNTTGNLFGAKPYVLINVSAQVQPTPGPTMASPVGGPDLVTLNLEDGTQVQATQPPPGGAYIPYGSSSIVSISKEVCVEKGFLFLKWTSCETQTVPFELPSTPTLTENNVKTTWGGRNFNGIWFAFAGAMTLAAATQGTTTGTVMVVETTAATGLTAASVATLVSAAAPVVLVGVLVCGGVVLVYYANATALPYTGPAVVAGEVAPITLSVNVSEAQALEYTYVMAALEGLYLQHNPDHDVEKNIAAVSAMLAIHTSWATTGGPKDPRTNQNFVCKALEVGGQVVAHVLWHMTDPASKTGEILVWTANRWVTYYTGKSYFTLNNPPVDIANEFFKTKTRVRVLNSACDNLPPMPPLAAP